MEAPVKDIPLTVRSYTNSFVKALEVKTVNEMYTYMNGINRTGDGVYDTSIRGFTSNQESNNMQTNGMSGFAARQNGAQHLERRAHRGPEGAGLRPLRSGHSRRAGRTSSRSGRRRSASSSSTSGAALTGAATARTSATRTRIGWAPTSPGPFGHSNKFLYRLIASYDDNRSFRNFVQDTDLLIAPSLTFNLSPGTLLTLEGEYRDLDKSLDQQLMAPQNDVSFVAPINVRYQEPDDKELDHGTVAAAYFTKAWGGGTTLNANWRSVWHEDIRRGFENNRVEADNRRVRRRDRDQLNEREYHFLDTTVSNVFKTGPLAHNWLLGLTIGYELRDFDRLRFGNVGFFVGSLQPGLRPVHEARQPQSRLPPHPELCGATASTCRTGSTSARSGRGCSPCRYDRLDTDFEELRLADPDQSRSDDAFVPTVGLVFQPSPRVSLYANFATSFEPQAVTAFDVNGENSFEPERAVRSKGG